MSDASKFRREWSRLDDDVMMDKDEMGDCVVCGVTTSTAFTPSMYPRFYVPVRSVVQYVQTDCAHGSKGDMVWAHRGCWHDYEQSLKKNYYVDVTVRIFMPEQLSAEHAARSACRLMSHGTVMFSDAKEVN